MVGRRAARDADDGAARVHVPPGGAQAREGGHEVHAARIGDGRGSLPRLRAAGDDAEPVAQPLDDGTAHKDGPFERIVCLAVDLARDGREQAVLRVDDLVARVHEQEAARAVRALGVARGEAALTEERRLLVARHARDGDLAAHEIGVAVDLAVAADLGQDGAGDVERAQDLVVPVQTVDVVEHRAARVGDVGHVDRAAREVPHEPGVHGAKGELARLGALLGTLHVVEDPADLGRREVRVGQEACGRLDVLGHARLTRELVDDRGGAPALPDDGVVDRLARRAVPDDGRLALVGDADGGDARGVDAGGGDGLVHGAVLRGPDLARVVLDPALLREELRELALRHADDLLIAVEDDRTARGGALVEGHDVRELTHGCFLPG